MSDRNGPLPPAKPASRERGNAAAIRAPRATIESLGARLRQAEDRYRALLDSIDQGFCVIELKFDRDGHVLDYRFLEVNPEFERQTGLEGAVGRWVRELIPGLEEHWFDKFGHVAMTGESARFELPAMALEDRWYDVFAYRFGRPQDRQVGVLFKDVTNRRRTELALRESEEHYRNAAELNPQVAWTADSAGRIERIASRWGEWTGFSGLDHWIEAFHPEDLERTLPAWRRSVKTGEPYDIEQRIRMVSGTYRWVRSRAFPRRDEAGRIIRWYGATEDIHDQKLAEARLRELNATLEQRVNERTAELLQAQEALRQSQKLEAMGQLTGGVAHDFNNLLTPIIASLDILQRRGLGGSREARLIDAALSTAERARVLVQRLLAFARRQPLATTAVDIGALMNDMAELVTSTTGPQIRVSVEVAPDLPSALADANQLELALLNLAVNARDAMPNGGHLRISAEPMTAGVGHPNGVRPGRYVRLSVADTGCGMDEATLARAVEPFFSTKGVGQGTGLGLSMAHGLAAQLGGALTLTSHPGVGTNVELWLPVSAAQPRRGPPPRRPAEPAAGAGRVLLVDDEEHVRTATAAMLSELGYDVVEASGGEEALRRLEADPVDLLVTDHLMPSLTGAELARRVKTDHPGLPILIISGYAGASEIAPELHRLTKPFRQFELAQAIERLRELPGDPG